METIDCGKPIEESRFDIRQCADCFDFFAGCAHSLAGYTSKIHGFYVLSK